MVAPARAPAPAPAPLPNSAAALLPPPQVTSNSRMVVPRKVQLFRDKFCTYHDFAKDPRDKKNWFLDRKCELFPRSVADGIPVQRKLVRPQKTWAITATVRGRGQEVQLVSGGGRARALGARHRRGQQQQQPHCLPHAAAWSRTHAHTLAHTRSRTRTWHTRARSTC